MAKKPVLLMILDGWGIAPAGPYNAATTASTPHLDSYFADYPNTKLEASGEDVGLPAGQIGNSEVGHLNIGSGRIIYQDLSLISHAIKEGSFFKNQVLLDALRHAKEKNSSLHLMGLFSDGGVHSHIDHLKALLDLRLNLEPVPILRQGNGHDRSGAVGNRSASEIRKLIGAGKPLDHDVPLSAISVYDRERHKGREIRDRSVFEAAILSRLRLFDERYYLSLPDAADGLGNRFYRAVREEAGYDAILAAAKTKRYPLSRIRRMAMCACLGVKAGMADGVPPFARVLAFNSRGQELLRYIDSHSLIPLITKPASVRQLSGECEELFSLIASAHDFYVLGYSSREERKPGGDWRTGPRIL